MTKPGVAPSVLARTNGPSLAYRFQQGKGPVIVFLPGYASDMDGDKAVALSRWAAKRGRSMLRLDYSGCGQSNGWFEDGTLNVWRDDALAVMDHCFGEPFILVGSSMGGWLAFLIALQRKSRLLGIVGIAAAPDFTEWGFTPQEKLDFVRNGKVERLDPYGPKPMTTSRAFWESGLENALMGNTIAVDCPVRLLQGQRDEVVPWQHALAIAERLRSDDVQVTLVKDGDHRLSRPQDIALLVETVASLAERK